MAALPGNYNQAEKEQAVAALSEENTCTEKRRSRRNMDEILNENSTPTSTRFSNIELQQMRSYVN